MAVEVRTWYSLRCRIIFTTLLIFLISICALSYYASRMLRDDMERLLTHQQSSTVSYVAAELNHALEERALALEKVARSIDQSMLDHPTSLRQLLENRPNFQDMFNAGIVAVSLDGTVLADAPLVAGRRGSNYASNAANKTALTEGKLMMGRPRGAGALRQPMFNMSAPIRDGQGRVIGSLIGVIDLAKPNFLDRVAEHHYGKSGGFLVMDLQHKFIVAATEKRRAMQPLPASGLNQLSDRRRHGFFGSAVAVNPMGVEVLSSASPIPAADWLVIATLPTAEAFAPIRDMQHRILLAATFLILSASTISWGLLRRQFAPLHAAVDRLIGMTDASVPLQPLPIAKQDEIGQLVGGFNQLLAALGQREAQLKMERDFFSAVMQQSSDGVVLFYPDDWRIQEVNSRICRMLGYERDELLALEYGALMDTDAKPAKKDIADILQGKIPVSCERSFRKKDGAPVAVEFNACLVETGGRQLVMVNLRDMTERKRAEEELRDLNRDFVSFLECTTDFIYFKDQDSRFRFCSQTMANITGHAHWREMIGKHDLEVFPENVAKIYSEEELPIFRFGIPLLNKIDPYNDEVGNAGWVNTNKWPVFDNDGKNVIGIFGISRDITELKRVDEAVRESERRFRTMADSAPVLIWMAGIDKKCTFFNKIWLEFSGRSMQQEAGDGWTEGVHPEDLPRVLEIYHTSFDAQLEFAVEYRLRRRDGEYRWLLSHGVALHDAQDEFCGYIGSCIDATKRIHLERRLAQSQQRMELVLLGADLGLWDIHVPSGTAIYNERWAAMLGYSLAEIEPRVDSWKKLVHPDDVSTVNASLGPHLKGQTAAYKANYRLRHKDGHWVWIMARGRVVERDAEGNPVRAAGTHLDISAQKAAEEAHKREQLKGEQLLRRIESLMKHSNDCIMMLDSHTRILEVSDGCVTTYGYTREELLGMRVTDLRSEQARQETPDFLQRLKEQSALSYQTWHCRKDGSSFPIEVGAAVINDGDERFIQVIIRDISARVQERSKLELELAAYAKRLELASQRVLVVQEAAKRRISGELHDRTSPNLAAIRINLAIIMRMSPEQSTERAERLEDTQALVEDTDASLREICTELRPPVLDYAGLAAALESYAQQFAKRTGIAVQVNCANGHERLAPALESLLFRIYQEALTNCAKHAQARSIAVTLRCGAQPIRLTIADDGNGFDLRMLENDEQVHGLGLLNMREMIEFSGGRFTIESRPGQGTRIEVMI